MRIVLAAAGSRGDVVPFGALAQRLVSRGHDVTLVTHAPLVGQVPATVPTVAVRSDPGALLAGPAGQALRRGDPRALNRHRRLFADFLHAFAEPTRPLLRGTDVLVGSTFAMAAVDEAIRAGVPVVRAHLWPEGPGLDGPAPLLPHAWRLPGPVRRVARRGTRPVEATLAGFDGWWERGRLHVVPHHPVGLTTATAGTLHAFSPVVDPALARTDDAVVTGWWRGPADTRLSERTERLLETGDPWVYIGFGSMPQRSPGRLVATAVQACRRAGVRALVRLPEGVADPTGTVAGIGDEPHDLLFPRLAAVVHHGGSGTTAASTVAGVPAVVVPHLADQHYWGDRLHRLGVAPRPLPRPLLSGRALAGRLEDALRPERVARAAQIGRLVAAEDGTGVAATSIEGLTPLRAAG